jgi:hypothetical protein
MIVMDAVLYPDRMLATIPGDNPNSDPRPTPFCSAVLLYFDSVILASTSLPHECTFAKDFGQREAELKRRFGAEVFSNYRTFANSLSAEETVFILWRHYSSDWARFIRQVDPLLQENVVRQASLIEVIDQMRSVTSKNDPHLNLAAVLDAWGFFKKTDRIFKERLDSATNEAVVRSLGRMDGPAAAAAYLCDVFRPKGQDDFLSKTGPASVFGLWREAFFVDTFAQSLLARWFGCPLVSNDLVLSDALNTFVGDRGDESHRADIALRLLEAVNAMTLPAVYPKTLESILYIRRLLQDDLTAFREALDRLAGDLIRESENQAISQEEIDYQVRKHLVIPLRDLERQLSHPTRELARYLLESPPVVSGVLIVAAIAKLLSPPTAALGLAGAALAGLAKTVFERERKIDNSGVGFLFKARENTVGARRERPLSR